jgi:hypothetical protein
MYSKDGTLVASCVQEVSLIGLLVLMDGRYADFCIGCCEAEADADAVEAVRAENRTIICQIEQDLKGPRSRSQLEGLIPPTQRAQLFPREGSTAWSDLSACHRIWLQLDQGRPRRRRLGRDICQHGFSEGVCLE